MHHTVNVLRMCNAHAMRPYAQWHKITVKILNYDTVQLSALELVEY